MSQPANTFAERAFAALTEAKKMFGEYNYHDKGADEVMNVNILVNELKTMDRFTLAEQLLKLDAMEDTGNLMSSLVGNLDTQPWFDELLEAYPALAEHY